MISQQQEQCLRRQALETLIKILRNLNRTIETENRLEAMANQKLAQLRQQKVEDLFKKDGTQSDLRPEEDDSNSKDDQSMMTEQDGEGEGTGKKPRSSTEEGFSMSASKDMDAKQ